MRYWVLVALAGFGALSAGCFNAPGRADETATPTAKSINALPCLSPDDAARLEDQVTELVNLERAESGLPPVAPNPVLTHIADEYACHMIEEQFFGHRDPQNGRGPAERAVVGKYRFFAVGENLAAGPVNAAEVVDLWMKSSSHREVILDARWVDLGVAVHLDADGTYYWVQEFGDPLE